MKFKSTDAACFTVEMSVPVAFISSWPKMISFNIFDKTITILIFTIQFYHAEVAAVTFVLTVNVSISSSHLLALTIVSYFGHDYNGDQLY